MDLIALLAERGMLLESARGPIPNVAELVAGEPIGGSWWGHPKSHAIFDAINQLADSPDIVRLRLLNGKITLVHRNLWAALTRLSELIDPARLVAIGEEHTASGAHRSLETRFPDWVPPDVLASAGQLSSVAAALDLLPTCLADELGSGGG